MRLAALIGPSGLIEERPRTDRPPSLQRVLGESREREQSSPDISPSRRQELGATEPLPASCQEENWPQRFMNLSPAYLLTKHSLSANQDKMQTEPGVGAHTAVILAAQEAEAGRQQA